ncbi:MAG TPA: acyl-phosphate glycerol 3-phosphate acyltransferase [Cyanobacteria bacterium UBA11149]|nr:acyl-phosphate glycerol 3-phosphate acyltransferase [Cyanobacteria bacterium UBA11367]HBE56001.1 acyl-phosphate glycerol 3-phosphate acyltransferase [Cyanobacteria bacterium UBA11366]HBK66123.1 acyl-phosphate glycerol 3-phosphate acyltransferase [Cyanobacteria bacterium UBA11166]HBR74061.1 acyl-phosphate glycerol 3-phosphate acyltransferase [Cyanobacteria bacterium UBA11159]HBS68377.1 acyl-phosphate glycerol 3-phosphate acyltransferase [Cyanobacteria bacterium UBA11153]HBW89980.1 acyl-phosp
MIESLGISVIIIGAYLLGSIPTGYLAGKTLKGIDIREEGSGSTGATNVLRTIGKIPALMVLLIDAAKGAGAIALVNGVYYFTGTSVLPETWQYWLVALAGFLALIGHSKSIWIGFSGGKSVATSLGVLLAMSWPVGLGTLGVFGIVFGISRIVSLGSIAGAIAVAVLTIVLRQPLPYEIFGCAAGLYVIIRHRSNIERLLAGTEPQIGQKLSQEGHSN